MPVTWHWDQGREAYWRYENIRAMAVALTTLEGRSLQRDRRRGHRGDPLNEMRRMTGLRFAANSTDPSYTIWRQYARVFRSALLATKIGNRLTVTDIARRVAGLGGQALTIDEYLGALARRFYCPSPAFGSYHPTSTRVYPVCVLVRYLISRFKNTGEASISLPEVFSLLIGNDCVGDEPMSFYQTIPVTQHTAADNEESRQVREMIRFFSQFSFLHWDGVRLHFDTHSLAPGFLEEIYEFFQPLMLQRQERSELELLELGRVTGLAAASLPASLELPLIEDDLQFLEGRKIRVTHLVTERNPRLRTAFLNRLAQQQNPVLCDMCTLDLKFRYPWTITMLEIHHLLPLAAPAEVRAGGTSLDDLVAACPNCHRGVHSFYRLYLHDKEKPDFDSRAEARDVYLEAKGKIQLGAVP
jgi:hypothetical protein